jgi:hypothetical protein
VNVPTGSNSSLYLFDGSEHGKASQVRAPLAPDFQGWKESHARCEEQIERLVRALRADENAREKLPATGSRGTELPVLLQYRYGLQQFSAIRTKDSPA